MIGERETLIETVSTRFGVERALFDSTSKIIFTIWWGVERCEKREGESEGQLGVHAAINYFR